MKAERMLFLAHDEISDLDEAMLVNQLNHMLRSLNLPISLISPTDLTPSLLVAILESILDMRISLIDRNKKTKNSRESKVQNMKIFLGVLETDILKSDVDLSEIDPRRLADGEWEEVYYIAELLCWIGRKLGLIGRQRKENISASSSSRTPSNGGPSYPFAQGPKFPKSQLDYDAESLFQGGSTITGSTKISQGTISPFPKTIDDSNTSILSRNHGEESEDEHTHSEGISDILGGLSPFKRPDPITVRCIHDIPSPYHSLLFSKAPNPSSSPPEPDSSSDVFHKSYIDSSTTLRPDAYIGSVLSVDSDRLNQSCSSNGSIRYSGYIEPVDEDLELESFEHSRSIEISRRSRPSKNKSSIVVESRKTPYLRTLELLQERTRLLTQLAELKNSNG